MSDFTNRKQLNEEDLEEIINCSEDSDFNNDNNQSYNDISPEI